MLRYEKLNELVKRVERLEKSQVSASEGDKD